MKRLKRRFVKYLSSFWKRVFEYSLYRICMLLVFQFMGGRILEILWL